MSYAEAKSWMQYARQRGHLNQGFRMEINFAQAMAFFANAMGLEKQGGEQYDVYDFAPHVDQPDATPEDILKALGKQ